MLHLHDCISGLFRLLLPRSRGDVNTSVRFHVLAAIDTLNHQRSVSVESCNLAVPELGVARSGLDVDMLPRVLDPKVIQGTLAVLCQGVLANLEVGVEVDGGLQGGECLAHIPVAKFRLRDPCPTPYVGWKDSVHD